MRMSNAQYWPQKCAQIKLKVPVNTSLCSPRLTLPPSLFSAFSCSTFALCSPCRPPLRMHPPVVGQAAKAQLTPIQLIIIWNCLTMLQNLTSQARLPDRESWIVCLPLKERVRKREIAYLSARPAVEPSSCTPPARASHDLLWDRQCENVQRAAFNKLRLFVVYAPKEGRRTYESGRARERERERRQCAHA